MSPPRSRRGRATLDGLIALVSILVTAGIVTIALITLGHGRTTSRTAAGVGVAATRKELIQTLGVLRTRQTNAALDTRLYPPYFHISERLVRGHSAEPARLRRMVMRERSALLKPAGYPEVDRRLVRVVAIPDHGEVALVPTTWQPSLKSHRRAEGLIITIKQPNAGLTGSGTPPTSVASLRQTGLSLFVSAAPVKNFVHAAHGPNLGAVVVPDGVAKVALGRFRLSPIPNTGRGSGALDAITARAVTSMLRGKVAAFAASSTVHDNVAAFELPGLVVKSRRLESAIYELDGKADMTWYAAGGQVIHRATINLNLAVDVYGQAATSARARFCLQNPNAC